jgi:alpha-galactosidase
MKFPIRPVILLMLLGLTGLAPGWNNGICLTPPMGWNSYYHYGNNINENIIGWITNAMVTSGMRDAGYNCVLIDDAWMASSRDASGKLQSDPVRFPKGIKFLADFVHSKGMKLGVYEDRGTSTCYGLPGSYDHEVLDAKTFADWGVDYIKIDNCAAVGDLQTVYTAWHDAIAASGRPMVFSICSWGYPGTWAESAGHLWRTYGDMWDGWDRVQEVVEANAILASHAGPGHWNDPDILQVGRGGMTQTQYRAHFSLWAIMAAPLIASGDLVHLADSAKTIYLNKEIIAVDQDSLGIQGARIGVNGTQEVWSKEIKDGSRAVLLFNQGSSPASISVSWSEIGLAWDTASVRDLWDHTDKGNFFKTYSATVPGTGVVMLKISKPGTVARSENRVPKLTVSAEKRFQTGAVYDLSGRRINHPANSGIYFYVSGKGVEKRLYLR